MTRLSVTSRAALATWRAQPLARRVRAASGTLVSVGLAVAGFLGALAGGWLADSGMVWLGLVVLAESAGVLVLGLNRDDGQDRPRRGARTPSQVLDDERLRP
jgi:hypothetical protein